MSRRAIALAGTAVLLVFIAIVAFVTASSVEDQLERDAIAVLDAEGVSGVVVMADGRDLVVGADTAMAVVQLLESVDGVRNVRVSDGDGAAATTTAPLTTLPPTVPASTTGPPSTTVAPTTAPSTSVVPTSASTTTLSPTTTVAPGPHPEVQRAIDEALADVAFETDVAFEPTVATKADLDIVAQLLMDNPGLQVEVVGHVAAGTDAAGDAELSLARAWAVAGYLEWRGVSFGRMDVSGVGSSEPIDNTEPDNTTNDRIEIRIVEGA